LGGVVVAGGAQAFGARLTQAEVDALAAAYREVALAAGLPISTSVPPVPQIPATTPLPDETRPGT